MEPRRPGPANRVLLTLVGLLCLASGAATVAAGVGVFGATFQQTPVVWPAGVDRLAASAGQRYVLVAVAGAVGLGALCWLLVQHPGRRLVVLAPDSCGFARTVGAAVRGHGGAEVCELGVAGVPGRMRLVVTVDPGSATDLRGVRGYLAGGAATELGAIMESVPPPAQVLFVTSRGSHTARRA